MQRMYALIQDIGKTDMKLIEMRFAMEENVKYLIPI